MQMKNATTSLVALSVSAGKNIRNLMDPVEVSEVLVCDSLKCTLY